MTNLKEFLLKLSHNLNIIQEREAKHAGNAPVELLNQISDHKKAIALTGQAIAGELSETEWREALEPLLVSLAQVQVSIEPQSQQIGGVNISDISESDISVGNIDASVIVNIYQATPAPTIDPAGRHRQLAYPPVRLGSHMDI